MSTLHRPSTLSTTCYGVTVTYTLEGSAGHHGASIETSRPPHGPDLEIVSVTTPSGDDITKFLEHHDLLAQIEHSLLA